MKSLGKHAAHRTHPAGGWSLLEMAVVMAILIIMGTVTIVSLQPVWKNNAVNNAYDVVLMALRNARQSAVNERHVYVVTFDNTDNTKFTVQRMLGGNTGAADPNGLTKYTLPRGLQFLNMSGIPNVQSQTPDNLGVGAFPVHFDINVSGGNKFQIFFQPDGSARDVNMNLNNGLAYLADGKDLYSSRAISLMGAAGRIRGWRLIPNGTQGQWLQQ